MIQKILDIVLSNDLYGAGEFTELAKGKNEYVTSWSDFKTKVKRVWQSRKK